MARARSRAQAVDSTSLTLPSNGVVPCSVCTAVGSSTCPHQSLQPLESPLKGMFGCLEWESGLYREVMRARCYPFNMCGHSFHVLKRLVHSKLIDIHSFYSIYHEMHMGYPMFIQFLSLYSRTLRSFSSESLYLYEPSPRQSSSWLAASMC